MVDMGADVNAKDKRGCSPLHRAAYSANRTLLSTLVAVPGINLESRCNLGRTPLSYVVGSTSHFGYGFDFKNYIAFLVNELRFDIHTQDDEGKSLIMVCLGARTGPRWQNLSPPCQIQMFFEIFITLDVSIIVEDIHGISI